MKFVPVEKLPEKMKKRGKGTNHKVTRMIEEFVHGEHKIVEVKYHDYEYVTCNSCLQCLVRVAAYNNLPVKVVGRLDRIFLVKE